MKYTFLLMSLAFLFIQCETKQIPEPESANLGEVHFEVTGAEEAQPYFHEGLLLLHSFEFEDAAEKFVQAQAIDSQFVMAYWGEAMTYNHPLWDERFSDEGKAALLKLAPTSEERVAMAQTDLERSLMEAVELLYADGDKIEQDKAYKDHMKKIYEQYPEHHEMAAFYALSLLGSSKSRTEDDHYEQSAKIVQGIIDENPNHPGALHYLIHSYDDPDHANLALEAANRYSEVAPDAGHALHMPSHIFVALGMWDEVIKSNVASYEASVNRMKEKELDNDARGYHAYKWLMYGHLQKENFDQAKEIVYNMKTYCEEKPSSRARSHYIMMKGDYLTETGNWSDSIAFDTVDLNELNLIVRGVHVFTQGMAGYKQSDKEMLRAQIDELENMIAKAETQVIIGSPKMCSGVSSYLQPPTEDELNNAKVLHLELQAFLALLEKDDQTAEKMMQEASALEATINYAYGPPNVIKPSFELYGEWLLSKDRKKEAQAQFELSLERAPKRRLSTVGLAQSNS